MKEKERSFRPGIVDAFYIYESEGNIIPVF